MPGRLLAAAVALSVLAVCSPGGTTAPPPRASPTAVPSPPVVVRPPSTAVLADAGGLPMITVRDHLTAAEYAAGQPDQVIGLAQVQGWGWADASLREWAGGGKTAQALVLRTDRAEGAHEAFAAWAAEAASAPFAGLDCPAGITGLDECRLGIAGARSIVTGRLDVDVFRIDTTGLDAAGLAAAQAQRLPAT